MTQIVDYASLQTAAIEYLARDQDTTLIARVPTFIQFFEAKMNRALFHRMMELRVTAVTDPNLSAEPEFVALPSDFQSLRRIRIASVTGKPYLEYKSTSQMDEFRLTTADDVNQPLYYTIFGNEIELAPTPDQAYTLEIVYRQNLPPLSTNSTNWLLSVAPDSYLYGTLMESAPYIKKDERLQTWGTLLQGALIDLNSVGEVTSFTHGGSMAVTPSGIRRF